MEPDARTPPLLELDHVTVMRGETVALDDVTLRIRAGEHVAILGPNGCGKSTLIKTITRECYPLAHQGSSMSILGRDRWNVSELRALMGIVSSDLSALCSREITGLEVVLSGFFSSIGIWPRQEITPGMRATAAEVLERLEVPHLGDRLMTAMSSGEARRILIGRALVHDPRALLLDEPSTSLDIRAQHELTEVLRMLARGGVGMVVVTHHLPDIIPEIERVILLRDGRVAVDGPKAEVLTAPNLVQVFGRPVDLVRRDGYFHAW
jgi:iron complex transport system ATP-binding protein